MKKFVPIFLLSCTVFLPGLAQEEGNKLSISGSVDAYWKYDFSGYMSEEGGSNIPTSFANEQNSVSIGMFNLILAQAVGKASFVGDVAFGPRGQFQSIPNGPDGNSFHIQNLYMSYALTDKLSVTAGYMGTFIGYEVISPAANFNYSTSYLFTVGPFQSNGIKANYSFSDRVGLMVGLFNDWNVYQDFNGVSDFGAQLFLSPSDGMNVYLNFLTGPASGTIIDLSSSLQITDAFFLGINAADYAIKDDGGGYYGVALYPQISFSESFGLGLRGEYFASKDTEQSGVTVEGDRILALTLSANLSSGPLRIIPEFRLDSGPDDFFVDGNANPTKSASQFSIAAVYAF
jgi:hypothetical protein